MDTDYLTQKVLQSSNYKFVNKYTLKRLSAEAWSKFPDKSKLAEKYIKNKLHQIYGAFVGKKLNYEKLLKQLQLDLVNGKSIKDSLLPILKLHSSTQERIGILDNFYTEIFKITGKPNSILDIACGFNSLTIPWMNLNPNCLYRAYDIDSEMLKFVNLALHFVNIINPYTIYLDDVFEAPGQPFDVVFLFKALQVFEQQKKGFSKELLMKLDAKFIVISFPNKSLTGKEKGMGEYYSKFLKDLLKELNLEYRILEFAEEQIFIVYK